MTQGVVELKGMTIALMVASGFIESEFTELQRALAKSGATLKTISCDNGLVNGWDGSGWGHYFPVDAHISDVMAADLDALIIPSGDRSLTKLKGNLNTARIIRNMVDGEKPVIVFGNATQMLAHADRAETGTHVLTLSSGEGVEAQTWVLAALNHIATNAVVYDDAVAVAA